MSLQSLYSCPIRFLNSAAWQRVWLFHIIGKLWKGSSLRLKGFNVLTFGLGSHKKWKLNPEDQISSNIQMVCWFNHVHKQKPISQKAKTCLEFSCGSIWTSCGFAFCNHSKEKISIGSEKWNADLLKTRSSKPGAGELGLIHNLWSLNNIWLAYF